MEDDKIKRMVPQMGSGASAVFSGVSTVRAIQDGYSKTADFFAEEILSRLSKDKNYTLLDVGTSRGELLNSLLNRLTDYKFNTIGVDLNSVDLENNKVVNQKIVASANSLPFADHSIDILIARYMLQWNNVECQKNVLTEISRVVKEFALIEHPAPSNQNPDKWRQANDRLFSGIEIPKLKRHEYFYYSQSELEDVMRELGIKFECLHSKRIENYSDIQAVRYGLNESETRLAKEILGDQDYFIQTDWIIYPKG